MCLPDSGSPIMAQNGGKRNWFLVGMLVHGGGFPKEKACATKFKNNLIYDLSHFYGWIVENVSKNS